MKTIATILAAGMLVSGAAALAADGEAPQKGYNADGKPITNPAEDGYDPNLVICRKYDEIGSRAKKRKVCLSNQAWQRAAQEGNASARKAVTDASAGGIRFD